MLKHATIPLLINSALALAPMTGCESLPGDEKTQGAVIGGLAGAGAGALIGGKDNRLIGALIGGALGAGGGYLIGAQVEKANDKKSAREAADRSQSHPVTADEARSARTADINNDGYVTLDEVVAMEKAGLTDKEIIDRLDATDQFFELTDGQRDYLRDRGVSNRVITAMATINPEVRDRAYKEYGDQVAPPK